MKRAALSIAAAWLLGCSGQSGVRVLVGLPSWDDQRPFDHIRVVAESAAGTEVACLFPLDNVGPNGVVAAVDPGTTDPFACADLGPLSIDSDLGADSWGLNPGSARSIDFVVDGAVSVSASAGFGGQLQVFTASAQATASTRFPDVSLALASAGAPFMNTSDCPIQLWKVAHALACSLRKDSCLFGDGTANAPNSAVRTAAMFPVTGIDPSDASRPACRVANQNQACGNSVADAFVGLVGIVDVLRTSPPLFGTLRGRFARCASGAPTSDCPLTTSCAARRTALATSYRLSGMGQGGQVPPPTLPPVVLSCLPPTAGAVQLRVPLTATLPMATNGEVNYGVLSQDAQSSGADACFFDLLDVDFDLVQKL